MQSLQANGIYNDIDLFLQGIVEGKELENWQRQFYDIIGIFAYCVDGKGEPLAELYGEQEEIKRLRQLIGKEQFDNILNRVNESDLEEQAIENTAVPNLRLGAVSVKANGVTAFNWLVCAVLSDVTDTQGYTQEPITDFKHTITEENFYKAMDWLRDISYTLINSNLTVVNAQAESRRSKYSEKEMSASTRSGRCSAFLENVPFPFCPHSH